MLYAPSRHLDSFVNYVNKLSPLIIRRAENNIKMESGVCYFASGEEYLTVHKLDNELVLHLSQAPFVSQRGSINMLFYSVAERLKNRARGVILSGIGEDGVEGMQEIIRVGGSGIVQDPSGSLYRDMPELVSAHCREAKVLPDTAIPKTIEEILADASGDT